MERADIKALAESFGKGDKAAFEKLYQEFHEKVFFFIIRIVDSPDTAEDLTSETFTTAFEHISQLKSGESFVGWLYSIAYSKCAKHLKELSRNISNDELEYLLEAGRLNEPILLPDDYAENEETKEQLKSIIDSLSPDMRAAVIMYYYDEMTITEVAEALETNENNVSQKLYKARKRIKEKVEKLIGKDGLFAAVPMSTVLENLSDGVWIAAGTALAVGLTAGLNKASGGIGDVLLYITRKYWAKHKKSLAALLFSGVLLCAVVCCAFLLQRAEFRRFLDDRYNVTGYYSFMWPSDEAKILNALRTDDTIEGTINVLGKTGKGAIQYEYGYLDDPYSLAHIPFESGRLPEKEGEIAIERHALDKLGFFGSVGDEITLDLGTYTLVGIIDKETYGHSREFSRSADEWINDTNTYKQSYDESDVKYIPMIYVCGDNSQTSLYSYTMLDNIKEFQNADELDRYFVSNLGYTDGMLPSATWKNKTVDAADSYKGDFAGKERSTTILCIIATLISSLSVIAVMRNIFSEREASISMLKKIGMSKHSIRVMFLIEYIILSFIQSAIGLALGASVYFGIYRFQVGVLEQPPLSGFTDDKLITENIASPYLLALAFSLAVLLSGYLFAAMLSHIKMPNVRKRKAAGLSRCIARAFANRSVTVIQTLALTLICFGTVFGYMLYYTTTGFFDNETGEFHPYVTTKFGSNNRFDFEEDGIEEYYAAYPVQNKLFNTSHELDVSLNQLKAQIKDMEQANKSLFSNSRKYESIIGNANALTQLTEDYKRLEETDLTPAKRKQFAEKLIKNCDKMLEISDRYKNHKVKQGKLDDLWFETNKMDKNSRNRLTALVTFEDIVEKIKKTANSNRINAEIDIKNQKSQQEEYDKISARINEYDKQAENADDIQKVTLNEAAERIERVMKDNLTNYLNGSAKFNGKHQKQLEYCVAAVMVNDLINTKEGMALKKIAPNDPICVYSVVSALPFFLLSRSAIRVPAASAICLTFSLKLLILLTWAVDDSILSSSKLSLILESSPSLLPVLRHSAVISLAFLPS